MFLKIPVKLLIFRRWIAAHMCVLSHFRTCDVRAERVWNCACVVGACGHIFDLRCAIALFALVNMGADHFMYYVNTK